MFQLLPEYMSQLNEHQYRSLTEKNSKKYNFFLDNFETKSMI